MNLLPTPLRGARHARVAPAARAAEIDGFADAQRVQRRGELADSVAAELVRAIDGELGPPIADDLALLAERAGDDPHLRPAGGVVGDGGAVAEALVVGMRVHEQQPRRLGHGPAPYLLIRSSAIGTPTATIEQMAQLSQVLLPHASRSRRRGEVLEHALYEATLAELAEVGYGGLTMEGIAARAHTGKAALYRRWASKCELVHAALVFALPPVPEPRSGRSARDNLLAMFTAHRDMLAGKTAFPGLEIIHQLLHEPEMRAIFADAVVGPRLKIVDSILQAAVEDGDIDPATITPLTARVGPALINQHFLLTGEPPNRRELALIVDTVIPPKAH